MSLFPELEPKPDGKLSADRRRTKRQRRDIANGIHPVTRLKLTDDPTICCGTCALRAKFGKYAKCTYLAPEGKPYAGPYVSNSAATDIRAWWPGCKQHQPKADA